MPRTLTSPESTALAAAHARSHVRVEVHDGGPSGGTWVDLSNMLHGFDFGTTVDTTVIGGTVTFLRSHTDTGVTLSPLVSDAIDSKRGIRIYFTTLPNGTTPPSEDYRLVFDGIIDRVQAGTSLIVCNVRDRIGAILADRDLINDAIIFTTELGTSWEDVIDAILLQAAIDNNANIGLGHDIPTDFDATGLVIGVQGAGPIKEALRIEPQKLLEALRSVVDRIGWQLRPRWNETDQDFQLAFYAPPHNKSTVDWTIAPNRYLDIPQMDIDGSDVVNAWRVSYVSTELINDERPEEGYVRKQWPEDVAPGYNVNVLVDEDSIARYGFRFGELAYEEHDPIRTEEDAEAVATIALAETAEPLVAAVSEHLMNWAVDIDDRVTLGADGVRFTSDQTWAVVGYRHTFGPDTERTELMLRGKPVGGVARWRNPPKAPATVQPPEDLTLTSDHVSTSQGELVQIVYRILGAFTPSPDAFLDHYDVRYRQKLASEWIAAPPVLKDATEFLIASGVGIDVYTVQMRAVNTRGFASAWVEGDVVVGYVAADEAGIKVDLRFDATGQLIADILGPPEWGYFLWEASNAAQPAAGSTAPPTTYTPGTTYTLNTGVTVAANATGYLTLNFYEDDTGAVFGPKVTRHAQRVSRGIPTMTFREVSVALSVGKVAILLTDPLNAGGTLSVWTNPSGDADGDPTGTADEEFLPTSTPITIGPAGALDNIKLPLMREKRIYAQFTTTDGRTTGIQAFDLKSAFGRLAEHLGEQTAGSVTNWMEWADEFGLAPIARPADLAGIEALPDPRTGQRAIAHDTGVLYYYDGDSWEIDLDTPIVQYIPALSAGIIEVEYLAASVGEFIDVTISGELTAYDVTIQGQLTAITADIDTLIADVAVIESAYITEAEVSDLLVSNTLSIGVFGGIGFAISSGGATATGLGVFSSSTGGPLSVGVGCDGPMAAAWFEGDLYGTVHGTADEAAGLTSGVWTAIQEAIDDAVAAHVALYHP